MQKYKKKEREREKKRNKIKFNIQKKPNKIWFESKKFLFFILLATKRV